MSPLRVVFAGGGTGGHLCPAIAVARALEEQVPESSMLFLGSDRPIEKKILGPSGYPHLALPTAPWHGLRGGFQFAAAQLRGLWRAYRLLATFRPSVVLGLGGFPSVAPVLAAKILGVPVALFEPNAIPGRANAILARVAEQAYVHWDSTPLRCTRIQSGTPLNPRAMNGSQLTPGQARRRLGLPPDRPVLLIMGGSQGSASLNQWLENSLAQLGEEATQVSYIHLTGNSSRTSQSKQSFARVRCAHYAADFISEMGLAYRAADLAVVRGGGATLAEVLALELPSLVVPMPNSAGDHQRHNARAYAATRAGEWTEEKELSAGTLLRLLKDTQDQDKLAERRAHARNAGRPRAAREVATRLLRLAANQNRQRAA